MPNENCAICGCDLALLPAKSKPVRHQAKVYCGECAGMVLDPDTDRGAEEIEVPDPEMVAELEEAGDEIDGSTKTPVSRSAVRRGAGIEVVEEFNIKAVGVKPAQSKERKLDDDEWFKQGSGPKAAAVAVREKEKKGTSISQRADSSKKPSHRMNAIKPADRTQSKPAAKPSGRAPAVAQEEVKKSSRRMEKPTARPSGRLGKPSPSRARMNAAPAEAPEAPPEVEEPELLDEGQIEVPLEGDAHEAPEAIAPAKKKGDSSRTMAAASSRKSSRTMKPAKKGSNSAKSNRSEREDRNEKGRGSKGRSGAGNNNTMMIGLGVAGLALLVIIIACMGGSPKPTAAKVNSAPEVLTSSSEYAEKAHQLEAAGDRLGAADMYGKAADAADAAGSNEAAQRYNMQAYSLRKFTHLDMAHGR